MRQTTQQPQDPNVQALVQTQLAETQRKAIKDQADVQIDAKRLDQEAAQDARELQAKILINTENNLTDERMKAAELTRDAQRLQSEQVQTVLEAQNQLQSQLGGPTNV
jgi:hypothetical protein